MQPIPYAVYYLVLQNKISPWSALQLASSPKWIQIDVQTRVGLRIPFIGPESEYVFYLIDTALMYYYVTRQHTQLRAIPPINPQDQDVLNFFKRFAVDRVGWFKALFRLFYE